MMGGHSLIIAMIALLSALLVSIGLLILIATISPLRKLIAILPAGPLRNRWYAMTGLTSIFIVSYTGYIAVLWGRQTEWSELGIPGVFLFGALFVWGTISLSIQTAADLRKIDLLEAENITDPLTKVYNRRYLDRRLEEEVARAARYALPLSILMLDIDHFKHVNDTYGHTEGDTVLRVLGNLLKTELRDLDIVTRYGGEEFMVICTNTSAPNAALVAERVRKLVESHPFELSSHTPDKQTIRISISIGVAALSATLDSKEKLLLASDQALYQAKDQGRNRVIVATHIN